MRLRLESGSRLGWAKDWKMNGSQCKYSEGGQNARI